MRNIPGVVPMLAGLLLAGGALLPPSVQAWPLTPNQRERLQTYLPRTFAKLQAQAPVHIVALGDSVTMMYTPDAENGNTLLSYHAVFADALAREFFYPGGVRVLNPAKKHPAKLRNHQGEEIFIENLADGGTISLDVFQPLAARTFLHRPDLVIVNYGINDAARGQSLEIFRKSLQVAADSCKQQNADLIIMGCSLAQISPGPTGFGLTRAYSSVAREVAEANGVLFVDLGRNNARISSGVSSMTKPDDAVDLLTKQIRGMFKFDPPPKPIEKLHPNASAHRRMGKALFEGLMNGPPPSDYAVTTLGKFISDDTVEVTLSLRNQSREPRRGTIGCLAMRRFLYPEDPNFSFDLKPGENRQYKLTYKRFERDAFGKPGDGGPRFFPADLADPMLRLSYLVIDENRSELLDTVTRLQPVGVSWTERRFDEVTDSIRIAWRFINGTDQPIQAKYRIGLGNAISDPKDFALKPLGASEFEARFPFVPPAGVVRLKYPLFIEIESDGVKYAFYRELEAARDIGLGEKISLSQHSDYARKPPTGNQDLDTGEAGIVMQVGASASALDFTFDFQGVDFLKLPDASPMLADLLIDARGKQRVRKFGFAHKLRIESGADDYTAKVVRPQMGTFGETYNMVLPAEGFGCELKTLGDGKTRRLRLQIPRQYLYRHEWQLGSPDSVLGINTIINMAAIDPDTGMAAYPAQKSYFLTRPSRGTGATLYMFDPRGFATLRLANGPLKTWSAWIY